MLEIYPGYRMPTLYNVFIFCGGKCGGSTLAHTLKQNGYSVCHLHSFTQKGLMNSDIDINNVYETIQQSCNTFEKVYFIDSYRTPIERKISGFFQNITLHTPTYKSLSVTELINIFNTNYLVTSENYHPMNKLLDYFKLPRIVSFDFSRNYTMIEDGNKVFVKLLFNDINNWGSRLTDIFNKKIAIIPINITKNRSNMGKIYVKFLEKYRVPLDFLDKIILDTEFTIYNSIEDQMLYLEKWVQKGTV